MASNIKEIHKAIIIEKSIDLFIKQGIYNVTMSDIAANVGIGEATLYRYFGRKQTIVILSAIHLWETLGETLLVSREGMAGVDKIRSFYNAFLTVFIKNKEYFGFIYELDTLLVNEKIDKDLLLTYEKLFKRLNDLWISYYLEGIRDHTIKQLLDPATFYVTSTHSILNMCKKLAKETTSLNSDHQVQSESEIKMLIDVIMYYLEK